MAQPFRKVRVGEKLRVPAAAYNAFIDAAQAQRDRAHTTRQDAERRLDDRDLVLIRNDSGDDQPRGAVLAVDAPLYTPADDLAAFQSRVVLKAVMPADGHRDRWVVLAEPIPQGKFGKAVLSGVCQAQVNVTAELAAPQGRHANLYARLEPGQTAWLRCGSEGGAQVLWRAGGTGVQWAVLRLGTAHRPAVRPVILEQVGGAQGDDAEPATWTYDVSCHLSGELLLEGVDPTSPPHRWQRPSVGYLLPATFGYVHREPDDSWALGWINEVADQEACSSGGGS